MRGTDLVVPVGADQQQVPHLRVGNQVLEQIERRGIQPLQIVKEQRERVFRPCERAEEASEDQLEAVLRVLRRKVWNRRLLADDELQLRDEVNDELPIRAQRLLKTVPPRPTSASLLPRIWRTRL